MSISASTIAQSLHTAFHRSDAQETAPMQRRQQFEKQLQAARQAASTTGTQTQTQPAGALLSSDLLKSVQAAIG